MPTKSIIILNFILGLMFVCSHNLKAQDSYQEWKRQQSQAFQSFKSSQDSAFSVLLGKEWVSSPTETPSVAIEDEKPVTPPAVEDLPVRLPAILPTENRNSPVINVDIPAKDDDDLYFIPEFSATLPSELHSLTLHEVSQKGIQNWWKSVSTTDYEPWLESFNTANATWPFNSWSYYQWVSDYANKQFKSDPNQAILFTWFIMLKNGYDVRIGTQLGSLYLLYATKQSLYNQEFFRLDGKRYYVAKSEEINRRIGQITTYSGQLTTGLEALSLEVDRFPDYPDEQRVQQTLQFEYNGQQIDVYIPLSKSKVEDLKDYPQTDFEVYFSAPMEVSLVNAFSSAFNPYLDSLSQLESVNFLLRFVQTAFGYKVDADQFGKEKHLFAEETLYYPYSDCEDRAVLFAQLVHYLLDLEVVGLQYPDHVATAVILDTPVGDTISYNGFEYTITDPTYIQADAGMTIPKLKSVTPKIIQYTMK